MLTLVIEYGRQRRKFDLRHPIDIGLLENQIKSTFGIEDENNNKYLIQIYDEQVNDYLDLTSDSFISTNKNLIKGQIISRQNNSPHCQEKVSKEQVVGLITLESIENSLYNWSQLLQHIQSEITKDLQTVRQTIVAVKSHYKLIDESNNETNSPNDKISSNCSSPSTVSQSINTNTNPNEKNFQLIRPLTTNQRKDSYGTSINQFKSKTNFNNNRRAPSNHNNNRDNYYPPSQVPTKQIEYSIPVTVTYQRFQSGVDFQGELSKYYNPTYFFLKISNQKESYDEMHRHINLYYNNINQNTNYFPQSGEFCVTKCLNDSNWYRARIIRLVGNEKAQLIFIDSGQIGEINVNLIQPLHRQFSDRPAQALACTLAQVLPFTQNDKSAWNRRACMSLENALKNCGTSNKEKSLLKVTVDQTNQAKWPMMFINISTDTIQDLTSYMCDLYLSRRCSNIDLTEYWSMKIRPEQYVLFNLSSLINQKQYFIFNNNQQSTLTFDQTLDLIINDPEFLSKQ